MNFMAYANYIVLLAPSVIGLQTLLDRVNYLLDDSFLQCNTDKTVSMIFRCNRYNNNSNDGFYIKGKQLKKFRCL